MANFICNLCDRRFKFNFELLVHLKDHENGLVIIVDKEEGKKKSIQTIIPLLGTSLYCLNNVITLFRRYNDVPRSSIVIFAFLRISREWYKNFEF